MLQLQTVQRKQTMEMEFMQHQYREAKEVIKGFEKQLDDQKLEH